MKGILFPRLLRSGVGIAIPFIIIFFIASLVSAQTPDIPLQIPIYDKSGTRVESLAGCTKNGDAITCGALAQYIKILYEWLVRAAAILAAVMFTWGGFLWLTAGGNTGRLGQARTILANALTGLVLALGSYTLLYTINPKLIELKPIQLGTIKAIAQELVQSAASILRSGILRNHAEYDEDIRRFASLYNIDCTLIKAIIYQEDPEWNPREVSSAGAVGLMQVLPTTANMTQQELFYPEKNIEAGVKYLSSLARGDACPSSCQNGKDKADDCTLPANILQAADQYGTIDDGVRFALAAYNGGPCGANVKSDGCSGKARWECGDELKETNRYVPAVIGHYMRLKGNNWGCEQNTVINTPAALPSP